MKRQFSNQQQPEYVDSQAGIPLEFQRKSREEQEAYVEQMCNDLAKQQIVYVKDEYGVEHATFQPKSA
jgi:hypothetical protein